MAQLTPAFVTKVSPWLAAGCVSPRTLYHTLCSAAVGLHVTDCNGGSRGSSGGQQQESWLLFELMWRDFFRFVNFSLSGRAEAQPARSAVGSVQHTRDELVTAVPGLLAG